MLLDICFQLAVCPGFYTDASDAAYTWASWGFAGTSFITAIINMHAMCDLWFSSSDLPGRCRYEVHLTNKNCTKEPGLGMGMASYRREYVETFLYLVGAIFFGVASDCCSFASICQLRSLSLAGVLFSPQYDDTRHLKGLILKLLSYALTLAFSLSEGTYLYLTGSICLLFASYINSIGLAGGEAPGLFLNMAAAMLALSLLGSACFCVGDSPACASGSTSQSRFQAPGCISHNFRMAHAQWVILGTLWIAALTCICAGVHVSWWYPSSHSLKCIWRV